MVLKNKKRGVLGVRNLKLHNKSLLLKWLWRYSTEGEEIWKKLISVMYGKKDTWRTVNGGEYGRTESDFRKTSVNLPDWKWEVDKKKLDSGQSCGLVMNV